jgi:hypothetical protein
MGQWSRAELDDAFQLLLKVTDECFVSEPRDLTDWLKCYTDDVTWHDLGFGFNNGWEQEIRGIGAVAAWMAGHNAIHPQDAMKYWPVPWYILDEERGWAVCEWRNRMRDPGTGEIFEEKNYSRLIYAGNRQWNYEGDIYNPLRMRAIMAHWMRSRARAAAAGIPLPPIDMAWGKRLVEDETEVMQRWSRQELETAFASYVETARRAFIEGKPDAHARCFTDDVVYRELGFGFRYGWDEELRGRAAVATWLEALAATYPNSHMHPFPVEWHVIDAERGWVVFEYLNKMQDPGNGEVLQTRCFSRMKYGGGNQWRFKEDIYDPMKVRTMLGRWRDIDQQRRSGRG